MSQCAVSVSEMLNGESSATAAAAAAGKSVQAKRAVCRERSATRDELVSEPQHHRVVDSVRALNALSSDNIPPGGTQV